MKRYIHLLVIIVSLLFLSSSLKAQWTVNFTSNLTANGCSIGTYAFASEVRNGGVVQSPTTLFYHWDFGNGSSTGSQQLVGTTDVGGSPIHSPNRSYLAPGTYTVLLRVYSAGSPDFDPTILLAQVTQQVTIYTTPTPDFSANVTDVCLGDPVTFTDFVNYAAQPNVGGVVSRNWNFGDGNQNFVSNSAINTATYTYTVPGDYQITLTTRTSGGRPGEECAAAIQRPAYIRVRHRPVASFSINPMPPACTFPYAPTFTNTSTIASTPAPAGTITSYIWRFYSGSTATPGTELSFSPINTLTTASPSIPPNAYNAPGTYAITLEAVSSTGCRDVATRLLTINTPQVANFNLPATTQICGGGTVTFTDASTVGASSYSWTLSGATPATSTAANPTVTFTTSGTYNISLNVTYPDGCVRTVTKPYTVTVVPAPVANFTNSPTAGFCQVIKNVTFTPLQAQNPNYSYIWNFGENIGPGLTGPIVPGYSIANDYEQFGDYNVNLTVRDNLTGCETTVTRVLSLRDPVVSIIPRNPTKGCAPLFVNFDISMNSIEPIVQYRIDYDGDGTYETTVVPTHTPPTTFTALVGFNYTVRGNFIPQIEITTVNGCVKRVTSPTPIKIGTPPQIVSVTQTGGAGGCQGTGISFAPVFAAGFEADSVIYGFSDGGAPITSTSAPFNASYTFTQNGAQSTTLTAFFNGCPVTVPFNYSIPGAGIQSPIPSLQVLGGTSNICTGAATNNQVCVNVSGTIPAPSGTTNYVINFGDGNQITNPPDLANICNTYANPGTYVITFTATGLTSGCVATRQQTITISPDAAITVDFNINPSPSTSCAANTVGFSSTSTVTAPGITVSSYTWNFGDGSPLVTLPAPAGANTTHVYSPSVTPYNPTLTLNLSNGCQKVYSGAVKVVNIQGPILTINATPSLLGCVGDPITFQGLATLIPNTNTIVSWDWDFGDPTSGVNNVATSQNAPHIFNAAGTYTVTLRVRDNNTLQSGTPSAPGCITSRTVQVQIFNKPTASFTINRPATCVGSPTTFTSTTNAGAGVSYLWDFGDGNTSTVANPTYTYTTPNTVGTSLTRTVTLTVTNAAGCRTTTTQSFEVVNVDFAITANGSSSPITLNCPPKVVNFVSSFVPSGLSLTGWTFNWQFGDGNQANTQNATNEYNGPTAPGQFTVIFTATNAATGCSIVKTLTNFITISGPRGTFNFVPQKLCKPTAVTFTASSLTGNPTQIQWDFGDGSANVVQPITPGIDPVVTHTYTTSGSFLPNITLIDGSTPSCRIAYPSPGGTRVDVSGVPAANFTWTGGGQICRDILVNFSDLSTPDPLTGLAMNPQVNRWNWTIYDGTNGPDQAGTDDAILFTSSIQNPAYTFTTAKTYLVRLSVQTAFNQGGVPDGCPAYIDKQITIVAPSITASINTITPFNLCPNEPASFSGFGNTTVLPKSMRGVWNVYNNPVAGVTNNNPANRIANFNAVATAGMNPADPWAMAGNYAFTLSGSYTVELIVTDVALCTGGAVATQVVTVDPLPTFVASPNNQAICVGGTASFVATPSASSIAAPGVDYQWQQSDDGGITWVNIINGATLGGAVYGGATTDNLTITNGSLQLDTYRYRCQIIKKNTTQCKATSGVGGLTVNQNATIAVVNPTNVEVCNQVAPYALAGNTPTIGTGLWTKISGPAGGTITTPTSPTSTITSLQFGTYRYRWTITNGVCPVSSADFTITNAQPANAGPNQNLCNVTSFTLAGNDPVASGGGALAAGNWTFVSGPNVPTITNPTSPTSTITGVVASATPYVFRWTITNALGCGNSNATVTITNNPLPTATNPLAQAVCVGQNAVFTTAGSAALNYQWQVDDNSGSGFVNLANAAPYSGVTTQTLTITTPSVAFSTFKYRVLLTNPTTTCTNPTSSAELTVFPANAETLTIAPAGNICIGTNVTINLSTTKVGYTYQLRVGTTAVAGVPTLLGNGAAQSFAAFAPTATNTYNVLITSPTVNGTNCQQQLTSTVAKTVDQLPSTSVAGPDKTVCATGTTLNANVPTTGSGTWVLISPLGVGVGITTANSATSAVTNLALGANVFEWRISNGVCTTSTSQMTVTRIAGGNTANAGLPQAVCATTATLSGNTPINGGVGTWTTSGSAIIANINSPTSTVSNLALGANTFTWTIVDACGTTSTNVTITREQPVSAPSVGGSQNLCNVTTATLSANTPAIGTGRWFVTSGSGVFASDTNPNTTVSGLSTGLNRFEWRISNSCDSKSAFVDITVSPNPPAAVAGTDQTLCANVTALSADVLPAGVTGRWTIVSSPSGGLPIFSNDTSPNSLISNLQVGTTVLRWTVSTGGGCASTSDDVSITSNSNNAYAYAGLPVIQCASTVTLQANTPTTETNFFWTLAPGTTLVSGTLGALNGPNGTPTITVSGLALGSNKFTWRVGYGTAAGCSYAVSDVEIERIDNVPTVSAGTNQTLCQTTPSTTLSGSAPTGTQVGTWSVVSVPAGANLTDVTFVNANLSNTVANGFNVAGNYVLRWTITNGTCASNSATVQIAVTAPPSASVAGANQTICADNTVLAATAVTVGQGTWTVQSVPSGAGAITFSDINSPTATVSGLTVGGEYFFTWTIRNGNACTPSSTNVRVTRDVPPTVSSAGSPQTICATSYTLNGNTPAFGTGTWSVVAPAGATVSFSNANAANATASGLTVNGVYRFTWTIANAPCLPNSTSTVYITINAPPTIATVGATQDICGATTTLTGNNPTIGTGTWTVVAGGATVNFPNQFNSTVSGMTPGINRFRWTITNGTCASSSADLLVNSFATPSTANAGSNALACAADGFLNAVVPTAGTGTWTRISGSGAIISPNSPTTQVTGLGLGANVFRWTVTNGVCPSAGNFSDVTLTGRGAVSLSVAGVSQTICGATYNLNANVPNAAAGETGTWSVLGGATIAPADINNPTAVATNLVVGFNQFTWTVSNGCATSVSSIVITRNDNVTPANAGTDQTVCSTTAQLSGNAPTAGTGAWTVVSGSGVFVSASQFNTQVNGLGAGTNTFRWTISNGATCTPSFDDVIITSQTPSSVAVAGANQTICADNTILAATAPAIGAGAWTVIGGTATVVNPTLANSQVINLSVGNNILRWTTSNGTCPTSFNDVIITRQAPPSTSFAGADQVTCNATYTLAANTPTVGTGVWVVTAGTGVVTNPTLPNSTVTNLSLGVNTFQWTVSNGTCPPSVSSVNIARSSPATVATVGINQTTCLTTANLTGNTVTVGTGVWTVTAGSATVTDVNNPNSGVTGLSNGINTFTWTISNACSTTSASITITKTATPTVATVGVNQTTCLTTATLTGNTALVGNGVWTVTAGSATVTDPTNPASGVTGLVDGINTFTWTISNACGTTSASVTITKTAAPTIATVGVNQTTCLTTATLTGNVAAVGTGAWTVTAGGASITDPTNPVSGVTGLTTGVNTFRWRISNTCGFTDAFLTITREIAPTTAAAGTNQTTCNTFFNALTGNAPTSGAGVWTVTAGTATVTDVNNPNSGVTGLSLGINTFRWTISNSCGSSFAEVSITRDTPATVATVGTNQTVCSDIFPALSGNTATVGIGTWTVIAGGATVTDPNNPTSGVTGLTVGVNTFRWTITNSCGATSANVTITRQDVPTVANAGTNQSICANSATLNGNVPTVGIGTWTLASAPVGFVGTVAFNNANQANAIVSGLTLAGNYTFNWTIANGTCPTSSAQVTVSVIPLAFTANGGANQDLCSVTTTNLTGNTVVGTTGAWTQVGGAVATLVNANTPNLTVNGLTTGTYTFRWTLTGGSCAPSTSDVIVRVAEPANAGTDQNLCSVTTATLAGNTPVVGTGTWTQVSGATATISSINSPNSGITGLTTGTYTFRWTVTGSPCGTTTDDVIINVVGNASAGVNQVICNTTNTTLAATAPVIGTGTWTVSPNAGVTITTPTSPTSTVTGLSVGTVYTFTWTISGTPCPALVPQSMTVTVAPNANAGVNQALCNVTTATLAGNTPLGGAIGTWTQTAGTAATISNPNSPNSTITGLVAGTYTFRWTISGGGCATTFSDVVITNSAPANAGINQNLCGVGNTTLAGNTPVTGTGTWTKISGPAGGTFANANSPTTAVTGLTNGTYIFQWEITGGSCPTTNSQMTILVSSPADAGVDISVCNVTTVNLNALAPTTGMGTWSQITGPSTANFSGNVFNATVTNLQTGIYTFRWTITGSACTPSTDDVVVRVSENANAGADQAVCNVTTVTLAGNTAITGTGTWTQISGNPATITNSNLATSTVTGLITGTYTFQWTFTGGICGNSNDQVVINVSAPTSAGANQNLCGVTSTTLSATAPVAGIGLWTQILGPGIASISNTGITNPTVSGLQAGTYVFRWTITGVACPNLFSEVTIVNAEIPNAGTGQTICLGSNLSLNAKPVVVGVGAWSQVSGPSSATFANSAAPNTSVTALTVGTYIFRWTVTGTACATNTADVTINVIGVTPANASASVSDTEYCDNQVPPSATVNISGTQNGVRYELRRADNSIVATQTGTGSNLTFTVSPAPTSTTTYTVVAIPTVGGVNCTPVELADKGVVTVRVCEKQSIGLAKTVLPLAIQANGSVNVTYLLTVRNLGNTELTNIQINDDLTTVFPAPARYSIVTPPTATGVLLANTSYTGTAANPNLLTGFGRLAAGETQTVSFTINLIPNALNGNYTNTAIARGERGTTVVTDRSTDGVSVDPDNDGDPRENTPTVFTLPPNLSRPRIGIAKNLFSTSRQANGSFNITYQMTVSNYGNIDLTNVQIVDDLNATFPSPAQFSTVGTPSATGSLTTNAAYTGTGGNNVLVNGGRLAVGESQNVVLTVNLIPNASSNATYRNTAVASGDGGTGRVTDNSSDGTSPDPNGDGDPREESPTPFTLPADNNNNSGRPLLGVAKSISTVARQTDGSYNVSYSISLRNYGNVILNNLQVSDDLTATFPAPAVFRITNAPTATGTLVANAAFTGIGSNANLLNGGSLAIGETQTVTFSVNLTPNATNAFYRNTAVGSGENGTNRVTDASTDGLNPDPNGDGSPDENIPTVLRIPASSPRIGIAKNLLSAVRQANGSFNLTYLITVRNYGNLALSNVQVTDNLATTFPSPAQFSIVTPPTATGGLVGNSSFTGTGNNINLLSSGSLGIGERQSISFTVNLIPNSIGASFRNTAIGRGENGGIPTTDSSTDGLNPDPDNDGDPREETPTIFTVPTDNNNNNNRPLIGVAKNLLTPIRQADGSYNFTYQISVRNYGNAEITNVQVIDDLTATFPAPATFRVISAPTSIGNLTTNPNYTGRAGNNNLLNGSGRLGIGESQIITFTVNVIPNANGATYRNTAIGTGTVNGIPVTDNSSEGTNPDPNGDGNPSEDVPTTFVLQPETIATPIPTRFSFTTDNCSSTILTQKIILQNSGLVKITLLPNTVTPLRGIVSISADGTMIYRPALNAVGLDSLEYEICNSINVCAKGKIYINVLACTSQPPVIRPDVFGTDNCTEVTGNVLTNDTDPNGTALKAKAVTNGLTVSGGVYSIAADGTFSYLPPKGFVGRDSLSYEACNSVSALSKCGAAKIYVDVLDCQDTFIPEGFSPNGDGVNDNFVIKGAERFDTKVQIFNRWGNLIYEDEHYKNTWNAVATVGILVGEGVPDGTYYYIVDFRNGQKPKVGFLTVQR